MDFLELSMANLNLEEEFGDLKSSMRKTVLDI